MKPHTASAHPNTAPNTAPNAAPSNPTQATADAAPARRLDALLAHYETSHRHPTNEAIHCVAIPLIMLSLIGLLYAAHPWLAFAFLGASLVYYLRLGSWVMTCTMVVQSAVLLAVVQMLDRAGGLLSVSVLVFVVAWVFQFIGHKIEGRKPSFLEDIQYLWVGPLFVLTRLFLKVGVRW